ncbi:MAG TPA: signal recognition particle-docking protein FtsY [Nitrospirales bacterium]|nr:signal recognition particle-docking protein FtsY [Nitrospirales bacterium]
MRNAQWAGFFGTIRRLLPGSRTITPELCEELETALLAADVGTASVAVLMEAVRGLVRQSGEADADAVRAVLKKVMTTRLRTAMTADASEPIPLRVILLVGVNGVGKTSTAGKLAGRYRRDGKRVVLVAGDTFRAAAGEQLELWGKRVGADVIGHQGGGDPAAVAFDGLAAAKARKADVVLIDTAGRLHTKSNLMDELRKITRTLAKAMPGAPHEVLLVLDATVGQNGLAQARQFHEALGVTGVVLTKLDGTAKGGIVLAIAGELGLPVQYIGVGEGVDDLQAFDPESFVEALLGA